MITKPPAGAPAGAGAVEDLASDAARLARAAGLAPPARLTRLPGGRNNRVARVDLADGQRVVLKSYFHDDLDRLGAEWSFLARAWIRGLRNTPEPLARDPERRAALLGFLPGAKLAPRNVDARRVREAAGFVVDVNGAPRALAAAPPASEACFSIAAHLVTVERRVRRLERLPFDAPLFARVHAFVAERLRPGWDAVRSRITRVAARSGIPLGASLAESEQILSPSDFGFHNALDDGRGLCFFDFEHAGRDDPAKLVCDFFCCPDVPVPIAHLDPFVGALAAGLGLDGLAARARLLLDAYRIKWACIVLNDFFPTDAARRAFASPEARELRCARQLEKAEGML